MTQRPRRAVTSSTSSRRAAAVSAASAIGFVVVLLVAGAADPGYSQRRETISALASTESASGRLMTLGFVLLALSALASGTALLGALPGRAGRTAGVLVVLGGLLTLVCGAARQSCSTLEQACQGRERRGEVSDAHVVHDLAAVPLFLLLVVAGFLIASALRRDAHHRRLARAVRYAAVVAAGSLVWFGSQAFGDSGGLVQRLLVAVAYGVPVAVALRTRAPAADAAAADGPADRSAPAPVAQHPPRVLPRREAR